MPNPLRTLAESLSTAQALRALAGEVREARMALARIADALEDRGGRGGAGLRSYYTDKGGAAEAALVLQDDADMALMEALEKRRPEAALDDDLTEEFGGPEYDREEPEGATTVRPTAQELAEIAREMPQPGRLPLEDTPGWGREDG